MAHPDGTSTRTHRLIGLAATLLLALTTALAFGRVFLGAPTTLKLIAVALASAGLAVLFERRSLLLATIASAAGVAIAVGVVVFPDTTWYGIPTAETLRATLDAAGAVGQQARIQVAPAVPNAPLLLAAVVSLWAAVFSAHALAFRAGSPLLGLIPPVALVAFADTVLEQFVKPLYGWAFLVAALAVVFADGLARVQGWGPVWSSSRRGVVTIAGRGARRLAATALTAALIAPILVPGFGSRAVIDFGSPSDERITIDPFVSVRSQLSRRNPVPVLRLSSAEPTYLRLISLPNFDGDGWRPDPPTGEALDPGGVVPNAITPLGEPQPVRIDVVRDLAIPWIPTPYPVRTIQADGTTVSYDEITGTAFATPPLRDGDSYAMTATFVTPSADELRAKTDRPGFGEPASPGGAEYLGLPPDLPREIEETAEEWTAGAPTVFDRAMAIQEHFQSDEFRYDPDSQLGAGMDGIVTFLREAKAGFCQQFATTMAVMLRTLDIPARVVVGFATGRPLQSGYEVTSDRAHAWVEVNFPGFGWLPFEPTPRRANPVVAAYSAPPPACTGAGCDRIGGSNRNVEEPNRYAKQQGFNPPRPPVRGPAGREGGAGTFTATSSTSPISARGAGGVGARRAGIGFLLGRAARASGRRIERSRAAGEPRRSILVTYDQFTARAAGIGLHRARGETLEEYRRKVLESGYLSDGHLDRLTTIATSAAYSPHEPGPDDVREADEAADSALADIRRAVSRSRWLVGLYRRSA